MGEEGVLDSLACLGVDHCVLGRGNTIPQRAPTILVNNERENEPWERGAFSKAERKEGRSWFRFLSFRLSSAAKVTSQKVIRERYLIPYKAAQMRGLERLIFSDRIYSCSLNYCTRRHGEKGREGAKGWSLRACSRE